ncbi:hypothetical protein BH10ACI3_BH10ACI3_08210 [soil metagenome]
MKTNKLIALVLSTFAFLLISDSASFAQIAGGYSMIEKNDPVVIKAANFAIKARSEATKKKFKLGEIAKAERQVVAGSNFRLCMQVSANGGREMNVEAVVYQDLKNKYKLTSWTDSTCGDGDVYKPIEVGDGGAGLAADYAVEQQAKKTKSKITPATIVKAEDQEPTLGTRNFRLCLTTTVNGKPASPQVIVTMDQYSNFKLVSWTDGKCGAAASDGFTQVSNADAGIGLAADFAVKKHSEEKKIEHKLAGILKAEEKGKFDMTYRICMKIKEMDENIIIQAVVTMDQYSNMKLVSWEHSTCGQ